MNARAFAGFRSELIEIDGLTVHARIGGAGPTLLLLHGHPQTGYIWHRVAPSLADRFTVVVTDLRGYGDSAKPPGEASHVTYSKRAMAAEQVAVMARLGFDRFAVLAHDRGARVAHRMALDHPAVVSRMLLLDIAPTLAMYEQTDRVFATAYFHWFFLIQPAPFPERLLGADPEFYLDSILGGRLGSLAPFEPEALAEYRRCIALPGAIHAMCEDYRAAATIDLDHDRADREAGRKVAAPLRILWGKRGVIERCFDPLAEWRAVAEEASGRAVDCGHYLPEEAPGEVVVETLAFLSGEPDPA
jgi:haloacetate dehalogenase